MTGMKDEALNEEAALIADEALSTASRSHIARSLAFLIAKQELSKRDGRKQALKKVKARLHQTVLSFEKDAGDYSNLALKLEAASSSGRQAVKAEAFSGLRLHSSTRERLAFIDEFYPKLFDGKSPKVILDMGCGLNPLSLPWMGLSEEVRYVACDASYACGAAVSSFFKAWGADGTFIHSDLLKEVPGHEADFALMMKLLPTLDRLKPGFGIEALLAVNAPKVAVTFPLRSLGGHKKGMARSYSAYFENEASLRGLSFNKLVIGQELAYIVRK